MLYVRGKHIFYCQTLYGIPIGSYFPLSLALCEICGAKEKIRKDLQFEYSHDFLQDWKASVCHALLSMLSVAVPCPSLPCCISLSH